MSRNQIGLDIAPDFIRAIELEKIESGYRLAEFGIVPTPEGAVENGKIVNPRLAGRAIRELFKSRKFSSKSVSVALRGAGAMVRILTLPSIHAQQLKKVIESEVNRYIMFSGPDRILYYHPLEEFDEGNKRKLNVLVAAARREVCNSFLKTIKEARLELSALDISAFCAIRTIRNNSREELLTNTLNLVYDQNSIAMNIFHGNTIRFLRTVSLPEGQELPTTNGFLGRLASEVLMAVNFYENERHSGDEISRVFLSLGGAADKEMQTQLEHHLPDVPIDPHSPFNRIQVQADNFPAELLEQIDYGFITAVGLAMRDQEDNPLPFQIDLVPEEITGRKTLFKETRFLFILLFMAAAVIAASFWMLKNKGDTLEKQYAQQEQAIRNVNVSIENARRSSLNSLNLVTIEMNPSAQYTPNTAIALEALKKFVPRDVQLIRLELLPSGKAQIEGITDAAPSINDFLQALSGSGMFTEGELGPRSNVSVGGNKMVRFTIQCGYKLP